MDKRLVSFLIGQKGERIKTIIENSQLIKIDFDNAISNSGERICLLYGNLTAIEDGIEYIEASKNLHEMILEKQHEIDDLQIQYDQVLSESGQGTTINGNYKNTKMNDSENRGYKGQSRNERGERNGDESRKNKNDESMNGTRGDRNGKPREARRGNNNNKKGGNRN